MSVQVFEYLSNTWKYMNVIALDNTYLQTNDVRMSLGHFYNDLQ